jgi:mannitol-1-phosphate/altronate dehydrogenase
MVLTNMPQATAAALGYLKGYEFVNNCCRDPDISAIVHGAMTEVRDGMAAAGLYIGADVPDPETYAEEFFGYFSADVCRDQVTRVLADPIRKLQVGERFLAPALLCLQHALPVDNLACGIAAAMLFDHGNDAGAMTVQRRVAEHGVSGALAGIAGLDPQAPILRCVEAQAERVERLRVRS